MGPEAGIQAWIFSFNPRNGWVDNLRFYVVFFFFVLFQSYQDDGKKIIIKLCAMELDLYMYYMYQVRGRYLVCVCARGGGLGGKRTPRL